MTVFKSKENFKLKMKLCDKRIYPTKSVKYLGVEIDANLNWQSYLRSIDDTE